MSIISLFFTFMFSILQYTYAFSPLTLSGSAIKNVPLLTNDESKRITTSVFGMGNFGGVQTTQQHLSARHAFILRAEKNGDSAVGDAVKLIIAGAPASGKGTQCETIKETYGVVHLSTGDMLRAAVAAGTDVGKKAKDFMDSGKLVPDDVIIGVVKDRLMEPDCVKQGWLLDGFPRTAAQAAALSDSGIIADCFIFLNVPDSVLVERVVGRRTDPETGKIYHMTFSPPESEEVKARLVQRSDDTEEKVTVRLEQFHANVEAVKDSYADIMVTIDGNKAPTDVSKEIMSAIDEKLQAKATAA